MKSLGNNIPLRSHSYLQAGTYPGNQLKIIKYNFLLKFNLTRKQKLIFDTFTQAALGVWSSETYVFSECSFTRVDMLFVSVCVRHCACVSKTLLSAHFLTENCVNFNSNLFLISDNTIKSDNS